MALAHFTVEEGRLSGQHFPIHEGDCLTLGRSVRSNIQIPDQGISRLHCQIEESAGKVVLTDMGSSNGTQVNGADITESVVLKEGDLVGIGTSVLRFHEAPPPEEADLPPERRRRHSPSTTISFVNDNLSAQAAIRKKYSPKSSELMPAAADSPELAKARLQLNTICKLAQTVYTELSSDAMLREAAEAILTVSGAERAAILLTQPDTEELVPAAMLSRHPERAGEDFPVSRTVIEETLRQGTSLVSSDARKDDRFKLGASVVMQNIRSVMCVPLQNEEKTIGVIYVDTYTLATQFGETDLALLAAMGQQIGIALERVRLIHDLEELFVGSMHTLITSIEAKDPYTRGHSERVTAYALMVARRLRLPADERGVMELAGLLHDVGKIGVPEAVLLKPDKLTDEEFEYIRMHPRMGARIIENMPNIDRIVNIEAIHKTVLHHHERFDGGGYPAGVAGEAIPLTARILAVADTYDAITSDRPYRKGRAPDIALKVVRECSGTQFDPAVVDAFADVHAAGETARPEAVATRFRVDGAARLDEALEETRTVSKRSAS